MARGNRPATELYRVGCNFRHIVQRLYLATVPCTKKIAGILPRYPVRLFCNSQCDRLMTQKINASLCACEKRGDFGTYLFPQFFITRNHPQIAARFGRGVQNNATRALCSPRVVHPSNTAKQEPHFTSSEPERIQGFETYFSINSSF